MREPVIKVCNAVVAHRGNTALRGVSLEINAGEFVGIIGPNGAGKTTLLTVINGLTRPQSGRVLVLGRPLKNGSASALRKKVGYVAQVQSMDPRMPMNVREVVMIGRYGILGLLRRPGPSDWEIVDRAMEMVGVASLASRPIGHLSGGERQRVAIARCLAQQPELFLLDEPTASLDWKARCGILDLVRRIHDSRGLTTIFVTHDLRALPLTCDRVVLMKEGLVWGEGDPAALLTDRKLAELYDMPIPEVRSRREPVRAVEPD